MVAIIKRMRKLRELLWIRVGPGALILPKEVSKISMEFNARIEGGHRGARKFWREMLPRIKYRNPTIPIQISRHKDAAGPSLLHIYTSSLANPTTPAASSTTTAPPTGVPETATPTHTINIKDKHESEILDLLVEKLRPRVVEPSQEELDEIQAIKDFKVGAEKDRVLVREKLERERREAELLRLARGEVPQAN